MIQSEFYCAARWVQLLYSVSQKIVLLAFSENVSPNDWEFLNEILHAYCMFVPTLQYEILFN